MSVLIFLSGYFIYDIVTLKVQLLAIKKGNLNKKRKYTLNLISTPLHIHQVSQDLIYMHFIYIILFHPRTDNPKKM